MKKVIALPLLAMTLCCATIYQSDNSLLISLEKTRCFGTCPVFTLEIYDDGAAILRGEENFDKIGEYRAALSKKQVKELVKEFRGKGFFAFEDSYSSSASDLPTTYLSFTDKGITKKITDYDQAPESLRELESKVESYIGILAWRKKLERPTN